jgi:hypothetical protein
MWSYPNLLGVYFHFGIERFKLARISPHFFTTFKSQIIGTEVKFRIRKFFYSPIPVLKNTEFESFNA